MTTEPPTGVTRPLSIKLAGYSVLVAMLLGLLIATIQIVFDFREEGRRLDMTIQRLLQAAAPSATQAAFTLDDVSARKVLVGLVANDFVVRAEIVDDQNLSVAAVGNGEAGQRAAVGQVARMIGEFESYGVELYHPLEPGREVGSLYLEVDRAIGLLHVIDRAVLIVASGFARNLILALLLVWLFFELIGRPLRQLIAALSDVDPGEPVPVEVPGMERHRGNELGALAAITNQVLQAGWANLEKSRHVARTLTGSEEKYRQLVEGSIQGIVVHVAGRILFANQAFADIFGYEDPDDVSRVSAHGGLLAPSERKRARGYYERRIAGKDAPRAYDFQGLRKDGSVIWLDGRATRINWEGRPAVQSTVIDITERKATESALRNSEERFRSFVEGSPLPIFVKNLDGRVIAANRQFNEFHELGEEGATGRESLALLPEHQAQVAAAADRDLLSRREGVQYESVWERQDGSLASIIVNKFPIFDSQGEITSIGGFLIDVTDLKRAEEQLSRSQKMHALGQLTGGVAHDFNNILSVVMGNLELLGEPGEHPDEPALVAGALRAAERGSILTQQLLAFSRKQILSPQAVDPRKVVAGMMDMLHRTLGEDIDIETIADAGLWSCEADPTQMENALLNLALNARDAMPDGGKLTIEIANARIDENYVKEAGQEEIEPGQYVMLSVSDTGSGMPLEVLSHVFEPFFTTKDPAKGTGLGLSMVYGFVKQSRGHITVYSEAGEGTIFKIYLKRIHAEPKSLPSAVAPLEELGGGELILVVEDDADLRQLAVRLLQSLGYQVVEAADGAEALAALESDRDIDLLFTDVVLTGGMNGRALAERARALRPGLRVLYTSGYTENTVVHHGRLDAGVELLQKPYRKAELARKIHNALAAAE